MILPEGPIRVWLATRPVDSRKQHDGLSAVVQTVLGRDPYSGAVFAFRSKRGVVSRFSRIAVRRFFSH